MSRSSRLGGEKITMVKIGDHDIVSRAAYFAHVDLCTAVHAKTGVKCTRAAGHHESEPGHPATPHVYASIGFVVQAVWG